MAFTQQSLVITKPDPDTVQIAIANETHTFPLAMIHALWDGQRDLSHLLFQIHIRLKQAGVNPKTATGAQLKTAIESATYWWGG